MVAAARNDEARVPAGLAYRPCVGGELVAHRPRDAADVQQADLSEVDGGERVADERIKPRLVDLDVEHATAAGRNESRLDVVLEVRHVGVDPRAVEDRADDVKVDVEARARVDDPEANGLTRVRG